MEILNLNLNILNIMSNDGNTTKEQRSCISVVVLLKKNRWVK